jgi:K+-sensing histidine kinase KdpD
MSDLLRENAKKGNFTNVEQNAEQINDASRKAFVLLDNLMQWVSVQKDNIVVRKEVVGAEEAIDEVLFIFREQSLGRNMTIEKDIRVAKLNTDKTLLQVILRNLISNAVKYNSAGGIIKVSCYNGIKGLDLIVEDNGRGFPESELVGLMSKKQGVGIAKKAGGLGLVLVREFVELLGGTIDAGNIQGGGARIVVTLPGAAEGAISPERNLSPRSVNVLTANEKKQLSELLMKLSNYELFDATEIRELVEKPIMAEGENISQWRKDLLQSVYLADESKYEALIKSAKD